MAAKTNNGAPILTNNPRTASASTTSSVSNANGSNCSTSNGLSPAAAKKSPAGAITAGAGTVDAVSLLKPSYINKLVRLSLDKVSSSKVINECIAVPNVEIFLKKNDFPLRHGLLCLEHLLRNMFILRDPRNAII